MSKADNIETTYSCTPPTKTVCHVYAVGGNSISVGTLQYNSQNGGFPGLSAAQKIKYWDAVHTNVWRLSNNTMGALSGKNYSMIPIQKTHEPLFVAPETAVDAISSPACIFPRLYELYGSGPVHIGICYFSLNGTSFLQGATNNWNVSSADAAYNSINMTKILGRHLQLTVLHLEKMGYDVKVKGILMIGQSVMDVQYFDNATYDKATFKTDLTNVVNYFRTTLSYTDVPFYLSETTQKLGYPSEAADWNDAVIELNATLGNIHLHYGTEWWSCPDDTHPDGVTGCNSWADGAEINGHKNMAELIYSVENP